MGNVSNGYSVSPAARVVKNLFARVGGVENEVKNAHGLHYFDKCCNIT